MDRFKSQSGFSLVEALVVLGITSVIGMFVMQMLKDSANASAYSEAKFDELEMARQIQANLTYKPTCEKNLSGKSFTGLTIGNVTNLQDSNGNAFLTVGDKIGNRSLLVTGIDVAMSDATAADLAAKLAAWPPGLTSYMMDVQVSVTTQKLKTSLGGAESTRKIPVKVTVDSSAMINGCFSDQDAVNYTAMVNSCKQLGGTYNTTKDICEFNQSCNTTVATALIPAKCVDEKIAALAASIRTPSSTTPAPADPTSKEMPWTFTNPGPGCKGTGCWASDFGPCDGINCRTNGGSCSGTNCQAGAVTGSVKYNGGLYSPASPGPGCTGTGCYASDYGPCDGINCSTNGGSCTGTNCRTGIIK
jgi:Type II secretory pathway, pseudopilin PulG